MPMVVKDDRSVSHCAAEEALQVFRKVFEGARYHVRRACGGVDARFNQIAEGKLRWVKSFGHEMLADFHFGIWHQIQVVRGGGFP